MIPVQNIYYLLCYAWDKLDEMDVVSVHETDSNDMLDLFTQILINGSKYLFKRGLDRYYIENTEIFDGIKGKFLIDETIKRGALNSKRTVCTFDDFSYNVLHNQILHTTLFRLFRTDNIDIDLRNQLKTVLFRFPTVDQIELNARIFKQVQLNKNNYFYDFLIKVCEIIFQCTFIDRNTGNYKFKDFLQDDAKMRTLFESFVRNFYKKELDNYNVSREDIYWDFNPRDAYVPEMHTDITLQSASRKIIIDTKFKRDTFQHPYNTDKIHSDNLYQLFAYLKNVEKKDEISQSCEGILLYPTVDQEVKLDYKIGNHPLKIRTINLNQHWKKIDKDLRDIIYEY